MATQTAALEITCLALPEADGHLDFYKMSAKLVHVVERHGRETHEITVVKLEDWLALYADARGYLPEKVWLLKPVAAQFPGMVCHFGRYVFVDGKLIARTGICD